MGLAALLLAPYWLVEGMRHGKYFSNLGERLGFSFPGLAKLPARTRALVRRRVCEGATRDQAGAEQGICGTRADQIVSRAIEELRAAAGV